MALIQRSCGYSLRPTLTIKDIRAAVEAAKDANPDCLVVVDNCYGEFTESVEPGEVIAGCPLLCQAGSDSASDHIAVLQEELPRHEEKA